MIKKLNNTFSDLLGIYILDKRNKEKLIFGQAKSNSIFLQIAWAQYA